MVKNLDGVSSFTGILEGDVDVESDFEGDFPGVENLLRKLGEKEQTRAVLIKGSFTV